MIKKKVPIKARKKQVESSPANFEVTASQDYADLAGEEGRCVQMCKFEWLSNLPNEKLLEVQKPFLEKVFGRRRQKLKVDLGRC